MRPNPYFAVLALLPCLARGQSPQDMPGKQEIEPIESALTISSPDYHLKLRQHLLRRAPANDLQFLILPSFEPEVLLSVCTTAGGFEAQVVRPERQIWRTLESREGKVEDIPCKVVKKSLPAAVATRLQALWKAMLRRTRYQDQQGVVLDGVSYCFLTFEIGVGSRGGEASNPAQGTRPFLLAEIGKLVVSHVEAEPAKEQEVLSRITKLMDKLDSMLAKTDASGAGKPPEGRNK